MHIIDYFLNADIINIGNVYLTFIGDEHGKPGNN